MLFWNWVPKSMSWNFSWLDLCQQEQRRVISYAVFHLFILSVVFLVLWGCIVTNQLENFQAISVSQIGESCLPTAKEQEDRAQWQHIRVPASGWDGPWPPRCPHQEWQVPIQAAGSLPCHIRGWQCRWLSGLTPGRILISWGICWKQDFRLNYGVIMNCFCVCYRTGQLATGHNPLCIKQPQENLTVLPALPLPQLNTPSDCQLHELNCFSLIYNIISEERQAETIKHPQLSAALFLQWPYACAQLSFSADLIQN